MPKRNKSSSTVPIKENFFIGAILITLAALSLAILGAFAKKATSLVSVEIASFYQFLISLIIMIPFTFRKGLVLLKSKHYGLHLTRDIAGFLAFFLLYYSLNSITLADAILLNNTSPLFIPLIIWIWFKKKLDKALWWSLAIGFVGVILILHPGGENFIKLGAIPALISGIGAAVAMVAMRRLSQSDSYESVLFYYFLFCTVLMAIILSIFQLWAWPTPETWIYLIGMGISLPLMQFFVIWGFSYGPASRLSPFLYLAIVFSGIIGWILWKEIPTWLSIVGTVLVIIGAILAIVIGHEPTTPVLPKTKRK